MSRHAFKFAKYFDEINTGIDVLIQNEDKQIELSAEMGCYGTKAQHIKTDSGKAR